MPSIAPSATGPTPSTPGAGSASQQTPLRHGSAGAPVGGRSRAPEAAPAAGRESDSGRPDANRGAGLNPVTAGGLVICAKSVRDAVGAVLTRSCRPRMPWGCGSRTPSWFPRQPHCLSGRSPGPTGGAGSGWNRSRADSGSRLALAWSASVGAVPFGRRRHRSARSITTDSTLRLRQTALSPRAPALLISMRVTRCFDGR